MTETTLTLQELPSLRRKTEAVSQYLHQRLTSYLNTLKPILSPERFLGKYVAGKSDIPGADKLMAQIAHDYDSISAKALELPRGFQAETLKNCGTRLELHRHEYQHDAVSGSTTKPIRITAPVRWIVTLGTAISPYQVLEAAAGHGRVEPEPLRQFVVNALVLQAMLTRTPDLAELFADLRLTLKSEMFPKAGQLPFVTLTSLLPSFRPADDLIIAATEFSGVPAFIELIDPEGIANSWQDPFKDAVVKLME
jgi:hypothetical protein